MNIRFSKATTRATPCYMLNVMGVNMLISYETIVSANYRDTRIIQKNHWGPTTGRHMNECLHRDRYTEIDDPEEFGRQVDDLLVQALVAKATEKLN